MNKSDKHLTSTHQLYSRSPFSSACMQWASCKCSTSRCSPWFDLTQFPVNTSKQRGGRRALKDMQISPEATPRRRLTNTGQWGKVQPLAPGINKPPHWSDKLSVAPRWACDGWRVRAGWSLNGTHAAFTRYHKKRTLLYQFTVIKKNKDVWRAMTPVKVKVICYNTTKQ